MSAPEHDGVNYTLLAKNADLTCLWRHDTFDEGSGQWLPWKLDWFVYYPDRDEPTRFGVLLDALASMQIDPSSKRGAYAIALNTLMERTHEHTELGRRINELNAHIREHFGGEAYP